MANTTQYQELVDIFFNKIKDYDLANMDENIATEIDYKQNQYSQ